MNTEHRGRVLVVDDEENAREALCELLKDDGYEVQDAPDGSSALLRLDSFDADLILTDLKMPGIDGIELLQKAREEYPHTALVVMTAFGSVETAVDAMKAGADNYLTKPLDLRAVAVVVERAVEKARALKEAHGLRSLVGQRLSMNGIRGDHPSMQRLLKTIAQVAPSKATVLIYGESGTGKELIAGAIHHNSKRKDRPFVRLNCASLAGGVLESELFGHEKGSFTGASSHRVGRFEQADGGTLFLDEVSEIPPEIQVKLLRFLQEREFERVGGNKTRSVDVRVVAASNKNLERLIDEGTFREDLYFRLNVIRLDVPPLRARRSDIPSLARFFLNRFSKENERSSMSLSDAAIDRLLSYSWPGNVRELENAIERAVVMTASNTIEAEMLSMGTYKKQQPGSGLDFLLPGLTLNELERFAIERTLEAFGGSTAKASESLGISQRKIQYRLKEWDIDISKFQKED